MQFSLKRIFLLQGAVQKQATDMIGSCETMAYAIAKSKASKRVQNITVNETTAHAFTTDVTENLGNIYISLRHSEASSYGMHLDNYGTISFNVLPYLKYFIFKMGNYWK